MNAMSQNVDPNETSNAGWRVTLGTWMFAVPFAMVLGAPVVVPFLGLTGPQTAAVIGGIVVAGEVIWFASIPLLGKQGFMAMKKKAFSFLKLKAGPISESRHRLGVKLFWIGLSGQLLLHAIMIVGYAVVGAHPERIIFGLNFEQQLGIYFSLLLLFVACLVAGVYALGADFADRLRQTFEWQSSPATTGSDALVAKE